MNRLEELASSPYAIAAGWTLLHFLWQGAALALGAALSLRWLRGHAPEARYSAGLGALLLMGLAPLITFFYLLQAPAPDAFPVAQEAPAVASPVSGGELTEGAVPVAVSPRLRPLVQDWPWVGWLAFVWLTGVTAMSLRLLGGFVCAQRLRRAMVQAAPEQWRELAAKWQGQLGIGRFIEVFETPLVDVPLVIGWLRPMLLLPAEALRLLRLEQIEALLIHELAHVKRNDYVVNLLQSLLETLLFFHPGVWWLSARVRLEREVCCDAITLRLHADRDAYAEALVALEQMRQSPVPQTVMAALRPGQLLRRIQRMYDSPPPEVARRPWGAVLVVTAMLLLGAFIAATQPAGAEQSPELATAPQEAPVAVAPDKAAKDATAAVAEVAAAPAPVEVPAVAQQSPAAGGTLLLPMEIVGTVDLAEKAHVLDELIATRLSGVEGLRLLDRKQLEAAMQELRLAQSGLAAPDAALQVGKLTGATHIVSMKLMRLDRKNLVTARVTDTATTQYRQWEVSLPEEEGLETLAGQVAEKMAPALTAGGEAESSMTTADTQIALMKQALAGKKLPRVTVSIPESHIGRFVPDPAGENEMVKTLTALGFPVVDVSTMATRRDSTSWLDIFFDRSPEDGDFAVALREGMENAATLEHNARIQRLQTRTDIFIIGEAFSERVGEMHGFQSCQARVEVKAIATASGAIAGADSRHANAADLGEFIAGKKALRQAGRDVALALAPVLANYWAAHAAEAAQ